ncbi:MAG TPA: hypothetical protein VIJ06_01615, partial [Methylovirgula sp.]
PPPRVTRPAEAELKFAPWTNDAAIAARIPATRRVPHPPEHLPLPVNKPREKKLLKIYRLENVPAGKVIQLFPNTL